MSEKTPKVLNPYIFIGIGGSGGKTLQYLHYYLSEKIKRKGWESEMPKAWQFLWFDVPVAPEKLTTDTGIPPLPLENYYSFTNTQIHDLYQIEDAFLQNQDDKDVLMGWCPSTGPSAPPIQKGAGQFRAVGRMITLNQYREIQNKLSSSLSKIQDKDTEAELKELTALIQGAELKDLQGLQPEKPIPVIISSLAGGCGAGSFLDIADILKTIGGGQDLSNSYAYLYTPDVFKRVDAGGLEPNALAATSELLSAVYSNIEESPSYEFLSRELTFSIKSRTRGPSYPILIGRSNDKIDFQEQENVYKTTSRALMGLTLDADLQQNMSNFVEANQTEGNITNTDITGLYETNKAYPPKFLSLGYSSVSLGRDYFKQYVVERFTSKVLDIVSEFHITKEVSQGIKTEQQSSLEIAEMNFEEFIEKCGLHEQDVEGKENDQIIEALLPSAKRVSLTKECVENIANDANQNLDSGAVSSSEWFNRYQNATPKQLRDFEQKVRDEILDNTKVFTAKIERDILGVVSSFIGQVGGSVTNNLLEMLIEELKNIENQLTTQKQNKLGQYNQWSQSLNKSLSGQTGKFVSTDPVFKDVKKSIAIKIKCFTEFESREVAIDLVKDIRVNLVAKILLQVKQLLENSTANGRKVYGADTWASINNNPKRLHGADNEFFVDDPMEFPNKYNEYIIKTAKGVEKNVNDDIEWKAAENICIEHYLSSFSKDIKYLIYPSEPWVPVNPSYRKELNSNSRAGLYSAYDNPTKLIQRTRDWIDLENNAFRKYLNQSLTDYIVAEHETTGVRNDRADNIATRVGSALKTSRPLINISTRASSLVHGADWNNELKHFYTKLPVSGENLKSIQQSLLKVYKQNMSKEYDTASNKEGLFFQDQTGSVDIIEFFTMYQEPVQPFIFDSLFRPIVEEWNDRNSSAGEITSFWQDRRTRNLVEFLPIPSEIIFGIVRGYFVAKLLGKLNVEKTGSLGYKVSVDNHEFPFPLIQVIYTKYNLLGVLMETLPLAQSLFSMGASKDAIDGYKKLLELGKDHSNSYNLQELNQFRFPDTIKELLIKSENPLKKIQSTKEDMKAYFSEMDNKQSASLQRKDTQTYDLRYFINSALESLESGIENLNQKVNDENF